MSSRAIHIDFGEKWEIDAEIDLTRLFNLRIIARLLILELVTGEAKNAEALIFIGVMKLLEPCELRCKSAFRCCIYNKQDLVLVLGKGFLFTANCLNLKLVDAHSVTTFRN